MRAWTYRTNEVSRLSPGSREVLLDVVLVDTRVGQGAQVSRTVSHRAEIGDEAVVGPFAALEPGATIAPGTRTGPFYAATDT